MDRRANILIGVVIGTVVVGAALSVTGFTRRLLGPFRRYPVVTDNDYKTWQAYDVEAWPTIFLLDKRGRIRWTHVGEGAYEEAEGVIQKLLAETETTTPA